MSEAHLTRLATATLEAAAEALAAHCPGEVEPGELHAHTSADDALAGFPLPALAASAAFDSGASGGATLVLEAAAARRLASALGEDAGEPPDERPSASLRQALGDALAAAAAAMSRMLDEQIRVSAPTVRRIAAAGEAQPAGAAAPNATSARLTLGGAPCVLVQLVPTALLVRLEGALEDRAVEYRLPAGDPAAGHAPAHGLLDEAMHGVALRVAAELGRARMPAREVVSLPAGAVVELDREVQDPIDVYVNGRPFARGTLVVTEDERFAVRIAEIVAGS